ncbi:hypothetical protein [Kribbella sp. NPDC004875]|uniref:hypothetical protein n=1 Tax=Kribbella sp. NPDC004875 TaxID=3364107 RepID=UPI0036B4BC27
MTVVSRANRRRARIYPTREGYGGARATRHGADLAAGRGPTRSTATTARRAPTRSRAGTTGRYLAPVLLSRRPGTRARGRQSFILWFLMAADLATVIWMYSLGGWLDHASKLTATATLGGHHYLVRAVAAVAFTTLATVAILSDGFIHLTRRLSVLKTVACVVSVVALTGLVALLLATLLSRLVFGAFRP